jgi:hypothetical protein
MVRVYSVYKNILDKDLKGTAVMYGVEEAIWAAWSGSTLFVCENTLDKD